MNNVTNGSWATAKYNQDFFCIETSSGYGEGSRIDPKGVQHLLDASIDEKSLGHAVLDALNRSRGLVLGAPRVGSVYPPGVEFDADLYDYKKNIERDAIWKKSLMERYGYKSVRELFKQLMNCDIERANGQITITPFRREGTEGWHSLSKKRGEPPDLVIPATSTPAEIGAALRLAFSRCIE
jgi:hypothetical protein